MAKEERSGVGPNHSQNIWGKILVQLGITIRKINLFISLRKTYCGQSHLQKGMHVF